YRCRPGPSTSRTRPSTNRTARSYSRTVIVAIAPPWTAWSAPVSPADRRGRPPQVSPQGRAAGADHGRTPGRPTGLDSNQRDEQSRATWGDGNGTPPAMPVRRGAPTPQDRVRGRRRRLNPI